MDAYLLLCFILIFALVLSSILLSHRVTKLEEEIKYLRNEFNK